MDGDSVEELERQWAATVIQHTWREFTEAQWSKWHDEMNRQDHDEPHAEDNDSSLSYEIEGLPQTQRLSSSQQTAGDPAVEEVELEIIQAKLHLDSTFKTLQTKESVLDLQEMTLIQQQRELELQQQKLQLFKQQQEREAKEKRRLAKLRAKECQEIEARRREEVAKFRALENMHIIKDVGHDKPPKPVRRAVVKQAASMESTEATDTAAIPKLKNYPRLPNLQKKSDPKEPIEVAKSIPSGSKAILCYAQDLTPLVNGEKPKRVKVDLAIQNRAKKKAPKLKKHSKIKVVTADNQFDELDMPPQITIPKLVVYSKPSAVPHKYNVSATPLTAEIKHIPWASTYTKELETPLTTMQQDFETTLQSILKPYNGPSISNPTTPRAMLNSTVLQTVSNTSIQSNAVSRRDFLLNKYGKVEHEAPSQTTNLSSSTSIPSSTTEASDSAWQYSNERLQSILEKYKVATTPSTPTVNVQNLLAKYSSPTVN